MGGHVLASGIFDAPSAVIDALCEGSLAFTPVSLTSGESFGTAAIGMHRIKMIWDIKRGCGVDVSEGHIAF